MASDQWFWGPNTKFPVILPAPAPLGVTPIDSIWPLASSSPQQWLTSHRLTKKAGRQTLIKYPLLKSPHPSVCSHRLHLDSSTTSTCTVSTFIFSTIFSTIISTIFSTIFFTSFFSTSIILGSSVCCCGDSHPHPTSFSTSTLPTIFSAWWKSNRLREGLRRNDLWFRLTTAAAQAMAVQHHRLGPAKQSV